MVVALAHIQENAAHEEMSYPDIVSGKYTTVIKYASVVSFFKVLSLP